jgi:hypothetical protein
MDILAVHQLHYNHRTESGVLFHLIGAVSEFGKLGVTALGNSPAEAAALYDRTLAVLTAETRYGSRRAEPGAVAQSQHHRGD